MDIKPWIPLIAAGITAIVAILGLWFGYVLKYSESKAQTDRAVKNLLLRVFNVISAVAPVLGLAYFLFLDNSPITRGTLFAIVVCCFSIFVSIANLVLVKVVYPQVHRINRLTETLTELLKLVGEMVDQDDAAKARAKALSKSQNFLFNPPSKPSQD